MAARRGTGRRLQRFNRMILARDPICTEPGCNKRSVEVDHDPPLLERPDGASPYDPSTAFGKCRQHHLEATRRLRLKHGLPYAPGEGGPGQGRASFPGNGRGKTRKVWEGAIKLPSSSYQEPAIVIDSQTGETRFEPGTGQRDDPDRHR